MLARLNTRAIPAYWDDFFNDAFFTHGKRYDSSRYTPAVNVAEDEKEFRIEVAIPGLSREDVRISVEDDVLTVSSERKENKEENKTSYTRREFTHCAFRRSFQLPETVDQEGIQAAHDAGILTIRLPKKEEVVQKAPRQIAIK